MSRTARWQMLAVLTSMACLVSCGGDPVLEAAGEPTKAVKIETYPDPPPEVAEAPPAKEIASAILPGAEHLIEYHVVTKGRNNFV